ncbi:MAG: bifunctional folylpolyglutamate synthase/dihydrofolate synthase [Anaerolineae bacterium]|nr:bifunctional folylpolyglutamate synthase/dihydrofolate synthase [Anaerolineae bacterium]
MLTYSQALDVLLNRYDVERRVQPPYAERVWRLDRVRELLRALGNPHQRFPSVHVAGTKGKGSTTAMIASILQAGSYRTGMYTSPHLHTFRERIQIDGALISEEDLQRWATRFRHLLAARPEVTVFEAITALAMAYMAEEHVDVGVYEVGLGGRLDATNVLSPKVSVITSISMDHMQVLGNTLPQIAREKAGIIKPETPVISAPQHPEVIAVIEAVARDQNAPLTVVGRDWRWERVHQQRAGGQWLTLAGPSEETRTWPALYLPLLGEHQLENAALATAAAWQLREQGMKVSFETIHEGLAAVRWPGRLEVLAKSPWLVVDGAHNRYSVERLLRAMRSHFTWDKLHLIFGAGVTHEPQILLRDLLPIADEIIVTQADHAKACEPRWLQEYVLGLGRAAAAIPSPLNALEHTLSEANQDDLILATGSLFLVADIREAWFELKGLPQPPRDPPGSY